jgi:hypothetical protein
MTEHSAGRETERKRRTIAVAFAAPIGLWIVGSACFWPGRRMQGQEKEGKGSAGRDRKPILASH